MSTAHASAISITWGRYQPTADPYNYQAIGAKLAANALINATDTSLNHANKAIFWQRLFHSVK